MRHQRLFASSMSFFRFALSFPKFLSLFPIPYPIFLNLSASDWHFSHSLNNNNNPNHNHFNLDVHDAVASFNHLLSMRHPPPIIEFGKILGSIVKMKHYSIAISLSKQLDLSGITPNIVDFEHLDQLLLSSRSYCLLLSLFIAEIMDLELQKTRNDFGNHSARSLLKSAAIISKCIGGKQSKEQEEEPIAEVSDETVDELTEKVAALNAYFKHDS
ncbi:hypothetical protein RIF29_17227 [Crotalaria pallida]|uniref:Uncharacterized protein n=1 Tax=Crotalaria pallida TaxID=3830 RepID=A0AAN9FI16_CROPI